MKEDLQHHYVAEEYLHFEIVEAEKTTWALLGTGLTVIVTAFSGRSVPY
jgi:hypothetical protein